MRCHNLSLSAFYNNLKNTTTHNSIARTFSFRISRTLLGVWTPTHIRSFVNEKLGLAKTYFLQSYRKYVVMNRIRGIQVKRDRMPQGTTNSITADKAEVYCSPPGPSFCKQNVHLSCQVLETIATER